MKKNVILLGAMMFSSFALAQIGINTPNPASTLDVTAKNATGTSTNVDGLLVPRVTRERAQSMTNIPVSTLIYVNSIATGTQTMNAINIDATGYYYFEGAPTNAWVKLKTPAGTPAATTNIYNADGTLTNNRILTQGANTLAFSGYSGTATNAFSVDGTTFSVDAVNDRVGVGTTAPTNTIDVNGNARVRSIPRAAGSTSIFPVYADTNGNLVKASTSNNYESLNSNTVTVASGATNTLITGINAGMYKLSITVYNGCAFGTVAEFYWMNTGTTYGGVKGINGIYAFASGANKNPTFNEVNNVTTGITWAGTIGCGDGGNNTQFNYTINYTALGTLEITNNGNVTRTYAATVKRMD